MTFDEIRATNPDLGLALYAIEPGQPVTLEVYTPDGQTFSWRAADAAAALALAFPPEPVADPALAQPTTPDIFG